MKKVYYNIYRFNELSKEAKAKAIQNWYEHEDFPWLTDDLKESCIEQLKAAKIEIRNDKIALFYSLSHSQGDGLCFEGSFRQGKWFIEIAHSGNYYHSQSVNFTIEDAEGNEAPEKVFDRFKKQYRAICYVLEHKGYDIVDYRMDDIEFNEHCESNDYWFTKDGKLD